jgi:hypothetical protein
MEIEIWKHGDIDMRYGNVETGRHGYSNMETWTHGQGDMDRETWTGRHGQGDMDMETWNYVKCWGILTFYEKNQMETEAQAIFLNPFTVYSSCKRKFCRVSFK